MLDMNDDDGEELAKALGEAGKFFQCNVLDTESVTKAVQGAAEWAQKTGKLLGGVIPAAGVSTPATVSLNMIGVVMTISLTASDSWKRRFTLQPR